MAQYGPVALPAQTAGGATATTEIGTFEPSDGQGSGVNIVTLTPPPGFVTVTGIATNNATFNVRQLRAGSVLGTIATITLNVGTNLTAEVPLVVPVTASYLIQANDVFDIQQVQNGAGIALGAGILAAVEVN